MPQPLPASALRIALIDDDSGMITVLDRRFAANRWESQVIAYAADPDQLTALKLHALIVNPAITGLGYIEWVAERLPGLALLVCSRPANSRCAPSMTGAWRSMRNSGWVRCTVSISCPAISHRATAIIRVARWYLSEPLQSKVRSGRRLIACGFGLWMAGVACVRCWSPCIIWVFWAGSIISR